MSVVRGKLSLDWAFIVGVRVNAIVGCRVVGWDEGVVCSWC